MNNIYHTKEKSTFIEELGNITPDSYDYKPQLNDEIELFNPLFDQKPKGFISSILETPDFIHQILAENKYGEIDDEQIIKALNEMYFCWGTEYEYYISNQCSQCWVMFEMEVSINKETIKASHVNLTHLYNMAQNQDIQFIEHNTSTLKLTLKRITKNKFKVLGQALCFIDGSCVTNTSEIKELKEKHQNKSIVENVAYSDELISQDLNKQLNTIVDCMCLSEKPDYHPGSGSTVRDIVHPSLYCYVDGVSQVHHSDLSNFDVQSLKKSNDILDMDYWGRKYEDSKYQWLPAEFFVDNHGKVSINSYINNLDKSKYPTAYDCLSKIFEQFLPAFEKVCSDLDNDFYGVDRKPKNTIAKSFLNLFKNKEEPEPIENQNSTFPLRNRKLQVVTKIVEYNVNKEENFEGVWHVEGMSHENILATGLYIFHRDDNFLGADIQFRRFLYESEGEALIYSTPQNANRPTDQMAGGDVLPLGTLSTPNGRAIVFPNSHIHQLSNMSSSDGMNAKRRILVFWLVNPDVPIVSTAHVEPQQNTMSFEEAKKYQLSLMHERKTHKEDFSEREVFLCEH